MLALSIDDSVESESGSVPGLGLLPVKIDFGAAKILGRPSGSWSGHPVQAYEIHHGVAEVTGAEPFLDGCRSGQVWGTMWHGILENDDFRRAWLSEVAAASGSAWQPVPDAPSFADRREGMINSLADALERDADVELLLELLAR